jgi:hypothetical protein
MCGKAAGQTGGWRDGQIDGQAEDKWTDRPMHRLTLTRTPTNRLATEIECVEKQRDKQTLRLANMRTDI